MASRNRGGYRKNAGRKKGIPNASTTERGKRISDLARQYTDEAFETLVYHMRNKRKTPDLSLRAAESIIAYGYGKPRQAEDPDQNADSVTTIVIRGGLPV